MSFQIFCVASLLVLTNAGLLPYSHETKYSPANLVSHSYNSVEAEQEALVHAAPKFAPILAYSAPESGENYEEYEKEYESAPANYEFGYAVKDPHTGDLKSQKETRKGDTVHGSYSVVDPDGTKRTVEYTADDHHGFNAVVHTEPLYKAPLSLPAPFPSYNKVPYITYPHH